jgi:hypothetical protein
MVASRFLISSLSLQASAVTWGEDCKKPLNQENIHLVSSVLDAIDHVILALDTQVGRVNLLLQVVPCSLQAVGLVNDILESIL